MADSAYLALLRDPRWQKRRLEIMGRDDFTCMSCARADKTLNVHHRYYLRGHKPWEYDDDCLVTLCQDCHHGIQVERDMMLDSIKKLREGEYGVIRGFVDAMVACRGGQATTIEADAFDHAAGIASLLGLDPDGVLLMGKFDPFPHVAELLKRHREARANRAREEG